MAAMVSRSSMAPPPMALSPVHDAPKYAVVLYYKYVRLGETPAQVEQLVRDHEQLCARLALTGRVRIAMEGINGTLGGKAESVAQYIATMQQAPHFEGIDWKTSGSDVEPFPELQVRLVQEIVAMEIPDEQCNLAHGGTHLTPEEFHHEQQANARERIALIDVRNNYEYNIGHFEGAMNPKTRRFGQFPEWVRAELPELQKKDKILMYCTGGIRCEKASAYLKHLGLEKVYQLQGGIHRYLEKYPDGGGLFQGKNFVFDQRVAMASKDPTITGKCERCDVPYDVVSGTRCKYCRMHILLCEACRANGKDESLLYCEEHAHLVTGDAAQLAQKAQQLQSELNEVQGKAKKGRRRSLRKQLDTVERRIQELQRLAICSDDAEGPQDAE